MMPDVMVLDDVLSVPVCAEAIACYKADNRKQESQLYALAKGKVISGDVEIEQGATEGRKGRVAVCSDSDLWRDVSQKIVTAADDALRRFSLKHPGLASLSEDSFEFTTPRVERIGPKDGFEWHMDSRHVENDRRFLTFVFYLNDVLSGGETEFLRDGMLVAPRTGRVLMIPPYWTHIHKGRPPQNGIKYTASLFAAMRITTLNGLNR
jgi:2OG-Fe(II) oxygenase superfamily